MRCSTDANFPMDSGARDQIFWRAWNFFCQAVESGLVTLAPLRQSCSPPARMDRRGFDEENTAALQTVRSRG